MTRSLNTIRLVQFTLLTGLLGCGSSLDLSALNSGGPNASSTSTTPFSLSWAFIDGGTTQGINHNVAFTGKIPKLATLGTDLYATWREDPGGSKDNIRVAKYAGSGSWTFVDGGGTVGINLNSTKFAGAPSIYGANGRLYVGWHEDNGSYNQVNVRSYDGTTWTTISPGAGMNYASASAANTQVFAIGTTIYCSWSESSRVHVSKYSGTGTTWTSIDGGTANGLSYTAGDAVGSLNLATDGTYLYATWDETIASVNQIRVAKYDGTTWSFLDGNGATGINVNTAVSGAGEEIASFNNGLVVAWTENATVFAKFYNGSTWTNISGTGLNRNAGQNAYLFNQGQLAVSGGHLVMSYIEAAGGVNQTRVQAYDGTSWTNVDGNSPVAGLNYNPATSINAGYGSSIVPFNGGFATTWSEASYSSTYQVRVKFGQ